VSKGKVLLVDEDEECMKRIEEVRDRIEGELGMRIFVLDRGLKGSISRLEAKRPEDSYRDKMKGDFPMCLFFTRSVLFLPVIVQEHTRYIPRKITDIPPQRHDRAPQSLCF
jgi:hypothetical protein